MGAGTHHASRITCHVSRITHHVSRWLLIGLFLVACGSAAGGEPSPPDIHYGDDVCEFCGMIVSETRYAAAYLADDGHTHTFDDIGDMVQAYLQEPAEVTAFFVHDHASQDWIRAETATFVHSPDLPTPMLSGLAAFAGEEPARSFAVSVGGRLLTFDQLVTDYRENPPSPPFSGR